MTTEEFKKKVDAATDFIVSCWDENNEPDGMTFDERVQSRLKYLDPEVRKIVEGSME